MPQREDTTDSAAERISGRLESYPLIDLLHTFDRERRSGKLYLSRRDGQGLIVFQNGKIVYAASSSIRETLGSVLVAQQLISPDQLAEALEQQHAIAPEQRLGGILVERGFLAANALRSVVQSEIELVLAELLQWETGYFRFLALVAATPSDIEVDAGDFLLGEGLPASRIRVKRTLPSDASVAHTELPLLQEITKDGQPTEIRAESTLEILAEAQRNLDRGILFLVRLDGFYGSGHFGLEDAPETDAKIRRLRIPLNQPSLLSQVSETQEIYLGALEEQRWNRSLIEEIGGEWPHEVTAIPMIVGHRTLCVLYGDNGVSRQPFRSMAPLGLLMAETSLALERETFERRERRFNELRDKLH